MYSNYYDYGTTATAAAGLATGIIILLVITCLIAVAAAIVYLIGLMKVFNESLPQQACLFALVFIETCIVAWLLLDRQMRSYFMSMIKAKIRK